MGSTRRSCARRALLVAVLGLGTAGCGGSGGGDDTPGPDPSGSYHVVSLRRQVGAGTVRSTTAIYDADGQGLLQGVQAWSREGGGLIGPFVPEDLAFAVDASRTIHLTGATTPALRGRITADGFVGVLTSHEAGADPMWLAMTRRRSDVALADVVGEWWWVEWTHQPLNVTTDAFAAMGEAQVLPNGTLAFRTYTYNDDGAVDPLPALSTFAPVTFPGDGTVLIDADVGGDGIWRGGLSEDGNLLLLGVADGTLPADGHIAILVRRGQAQEVADLAGDLGVFGFQSVGAEFACTFGTATIPGLTGGSWTFSGNRDGTILGASTRPVDAFVWVSGEVRLDIPTSQVFRGGIGRQGDYGVVGGNFSAGGHPTALFWVR